MSASNHIQDYISATKAISEAWGRLSKALAEMDEGLAFQLSRTECSRQKAYELMAVTEGLNQFAELAEAHRAKRSP